MMLRKFARRLLGYDELEQKIKDLDDRQDRHLEMVYDELLKLGANPKWIVPRKITAEEISAASIMAARIDPFVFQEDQSPLNDKEMAA